MTWRSWRACKAIAIIDKGRAPSPRTAQIPKLEKPKDVPTAISSADSTMPIPTPAKSAGAPW
ncbi:hypothetical protein GGR75_000431 [Xanthomonas campestris]|nr:hypothetical protein [Xanthomonas campestris]